MKRKQLNNKNLPVVKVSYRGKRIGMYCAKLVGDSSIILHHGVISFPVGTALTIHFNRFSDPNTTIRKRVMATVLNNSTSGMLLGLWVAVGKQLV